MSTRKAAIAIPFWEGDSFTNLLSYLESLSSIGQILIYACSNGSLAKGSRKVVSESILSSRGLYSILTSSNYSDLLVLLKPGALKFYDKAFPSYFDRLEKGNIGMVYSSFTTECDGKKKDYPLSVYQPGSVRDDFDFGPLVALNLNRISDRLKQNIRSSDLKYAAFYGLVLRMGANDLPAYIPEYLYTQVGGGIEDFETSLFSYVDSDNRNKQLEMEQVFTDFSKEAGFFLEEVTKKINFCEENFSTELSVIIPVKNREKTIGDAIESALSQKGNFPFNVIIVDNHSIDSTTNIIESWRVKDSRVIHIVPERHDLGIGGCWDLAIRSEFAGRFVVQLDSDDLYAHENVLISILEKFNQTGAAAVVGSYTLVDFDLKELSPGLIDHKEWTDGNGHNNGLRINGFGAPRAFYTPVLREIGFPNVSYGEDYAVMLAVTRKYKLGRIYDSLYLCRRWGENSESNITQETINKHNYFKDSLRTNEILGRLKLNNKAPIE